VLPRTLLTPEDVARSEDRFRVHHARRRGRRWYLLWLLVGPGILAMLGENDGPSMISYATTGATYGLGFFLPFIILTFAMAVVVQEMCMRVGAVTHRGYGQLVLERYGKLWGWFSAGDLMVTNLVTLIAEFVAIRIGMSYFHVGPAIAATLGVSLVALTMTGGRYWRWERVVLVRDGGSCVRHALAAARRQPEHSAAADRLDRRCDGDAVDDLLSTERLGRQRIDRA
jgi:Mn2+/Fe2+ NRAMP family transporter